MRFEICAANLGEIGLCLRDCPEIGLSILLGMFWKGASSLWVCTLMICCVQTLQIDEGRTVQQITMTPTYVFQQLPSLL